MAAITTFRDLKVYQRAHAIFKLSRTFPREEQYALTDQLRRASRAVTAMLGEAWARRRYEAVFVSKVSEALGEATETQVWLDHALDSGYIDAEQHRVADQAWAEIGAMLRGMIDKAPAFCAAQKAK